MGGIRHPTLADSGGRFLNWKILSNPGINGKEGVDIKIAYFISIIRFICP
jgi:hypothetical protein